MADDLLPSPTAPTGFGPSNSSPIRPGVDYRQVQQATDLIQPWHIPQSGKEQEFASLSQAFKDFSNDAATVGQHFSKQEGTAAGAAAGMDPGFTPKTGLAAVTTSGEAFNAAAHVTYVANTQTSIEAAVASAEEANPRDPIAYQQQVQAARDATLKQTPALYQPEVQTMFDRRITAGQARINEATINGNKADAEYAFTSTLTPRLKDAVRTAQELPADQQGAVMQQFVHDTGTMVDGLVTSGAWSQTRADAVKEQILDMTTQAVHANYADNIAKGYMDTVRRGDVDTADKQVQSYMSDPANSDQDKSAVLQAFEKQREEYTKFQGQLHANDIASVDQQLVQGTGTLKGVGAYGPAIESTIRSQYNQGWISPEAMQARMVQARRNELVGTQTDAGNQLIDDAVHNHTGLDPSDKATVKATGPYFDAHMQLNNTPYGTPGYAVSAASFTHTTNIVPPTVKANIRVGLLSNDPDQVAYAARLSDELKKANPQAALFDDSEPKLQSLSSIVVDNLNAGASSQQALAMATKQVDVTPEQKKIREDDYSAALKKASSDKPEQVSTLALQSRLNAAFAPHFWQGAAPAAPVAMRAEFDSLTRQFYTQTGDLGKAQDLASGQLLKSWGPSKVNGQPELMKWPVPDSDVARVRQNVEDTAKANNYQGDPNHVTLVPASGLTDPSQGRFWQLHYTDKDGVEEPLLGADNRPVLFDMAKGKPDFATTQAALAAQKIQSARALRDQQQQTDAIMNGSAGARAARAEMSAPGP